MSRMKILGFLLGFALAAIPFIAFAGESAGH